MFDVHIAKTIIAAFATTPRTATNFDPALVCNIQVAGVVHAFYEYGWEEGSAYGADYIPGLCCETTDSVLSRRLGYTSLHVERVVPISVAITCVLCLHEMQRISPMG